MVDRFAFPEASWKINKFGNWVRISDYELVEKRAVDAAANLEACRTLNANLRVEAESLRSENDRLRGELARVRAETVEECAKVAEAEPIFEGDPPHLILAAMEDAGPAMNARAAGNATKRSIAAAIRALEPRHEAGE